MAEERLLYLASEHRFARRRAARVDELSQAAAEVLAIVDRLYYEGRLDEMLCGLPPSSPAADPLVLIEKIASHLALDIGWNNYKALAFTTLDALGRWAQANPILNGDQPVTTRIGSEQRPNRTLALEALPEAHHQTTADAAAEEINVRTAKVPSGWKTSN